MHTAKRCCFAGLLLTIATSAFLAAQNAGSLTASPDASASPELRKSKLIARLWHGRTMASKADAYEAYLNASGVARMLATQGNRGVEVLRRTQGTTTDFIVISYWDSIAAIQKFAGKDYKKAVILDQDRQYLLEVEPNVLHYEVVRAAGH
jgi:heme-degrading monooxygenase HmoA